MLISAFAWIGFLYVTRGTAVRHVRGVGAGGAPVGVSEPEFPLSVTMLTGAWLASGNRVQVLFNGDGTYPRLWQDLRSAQRAITLQVYYGNTGRMADTLRAILVERAKADFYRVFPARTMRKIDVVAILFANAREMQIGCGGTALIGSDHIMAIAMMVFPWM